MTFGPLKGRNPSDRSPQECRDRRNPPATASVAKDPSSVEKVGVSSVDGGGWRKANDDGDLLKPSLQPASGAAWRVCGGFGLRRRGGTRLWHRICRPRQGATTVYLKHRELVRQQLGVDLVLLLLDQVPNAMRCQMVERHQRLAM